MAVKIMLLCFMFLITAYEIKEIKREGEEVTVNGKTYVKCYSKTSCIASAIITIAYDLFTVYVLTLI